MRTKVALFPVLLITLICCQPEKQKKYYDDGQLKKEYVMNNRGELDGPYTSYYQNGNIKMTGSYSNGARDDTFKKYYSDGTLKWKGYYDNGEEEDIHKKIYKNGKVRVKGNFKNGKQHGLTKKYYKDGTLKKIIHYKNDLEHGKYVSFYKNGDVKHLKKSKNDSTVAYIDYAKDGSVNDAYFDINIQAPDTTSINDSIKAKVQIANLDTKKYMNDTIFSFWAVQKPGQVSSKKQILLNGQELTLNSDGIGNFIYSPSNPGIHNLIVGIAFDDDVSYSYKFNKLTVLDIIKSDQ